MKLTGILLSLCGVLALSGCQDFGAQPIFGLRGTPWKLQSFETVDGDVITDLNGRTYSITFPDDSTAAVRADCNSCSAVYETAGSFMEVTVQSCTEMYCGPESLDEQFIDGLNRTTSFRLLGNLLILRDDGNAVLNFTAQQN